MTTISSMRSFDENTVPTSDVFPGNESGPTFSHVTLHDIDIGSNLNRYVYRSKNPLSGVAVTDAKRTMLSHHLAKIAPITGSNSDAGLWQSYNCNVPSSVRRDSCKEVHENSSILATTFQLKRDESQHRDHQFVPESNSLKSLSDADDRRISYIARPHYNYQTCVPNRDVTEQIHSSYDNYQTLMCRQDYRGRPTAEKSFESRDKVMGKIMIEIEPGEYMRLRGADETWRAIKYDFYMPSICVCCNLTLFCIQDATYVLCPDCRVVSSLGKVDGFDGGIGIGFKMEELNKWQLEIKKGSSMYR